MKARLLLILALITPPVLAQDAPPDYEQAFAEANSQRQRGDYPGAIAAYRALYQASACPALLRRKSGYLIGLCHESLFQYSEAIAAYQKLAEDFPGSAEAANARAQIHGLTLYQGDGFAALKAQIKAHKLNDEGRHDEAVALLHELGVPAATAGLPEEKLAAWDPDLFSILGDAHYARRRYEQAAEAYAAADRLGLPDAAEMRDRALRSITRRRLGHGARAIIALLALLLLLKKPWRYLDRRRLKVLAAILAAWTLFAAAMVGLGATLDVAHDHERPISPASIIVAAALLALPLLAAALFASIGKRRPVVDGLYALIALAASLFWILERWDWLMMLGL